MARLDDALAEAERLHRKMQDVSKAAAEGQVKELVSLRARFATVIAEMAGAIREDSRLAKNPDMAKEFQDQFFKVRRGLAEHQSHWRANEIQQNEAAYRSAVRGLSSLQENFYNWGRQTLAKL